MSGKQSAESRRQSGGTSPTGCLLLFDAFGGVALAFWVGDDGETVVEVRRDEEPSAVIAEREPRRVDGRRARDCART